MDYNAESGRPSYMEGCKQTGGILGLENRGWHTQENEQEDRDLELDDSVGVSQELLSWFRRSSMVVLDVVSDTDRGEGRDNGMEVEVEDVLSSFVNAR